MFVCDGLQHAVEENRIEKNLIVRSDVSEAETTNNKILRSTFCIEAIQTRSTRGLFATAELLVTSHTSQLTSTVG